MVLSTDVPYHENASIDVGVLSQAETKNYEPLTRQDENKLMLLRPLLHTCPGTTSTCRISASTEKWLSTSESMLLSPMHEKKRGEISPEQIDVLLIHQARVTLWAIKEISMSDSWPRIEMTPDSPAQKAGAMKKFSRVMSWSVPDRFLRGVAGLLPRFSTRKETLPSSYSSWYPNSKAKSTLS